MLLEQIIELKNINVQLTLSATELWQRRLTEPMIPTTENLQNSNEFSYYFSL